MFSKESNPELFLKGEVFLKYGKLGDPHKRLVYFDENHDNLIWCKENKSNIRKIPTSEIHEVKLGVSSSKVLVKNKVNEGLDKVVFSVHSNGRTLDLQADSEEVRNRWVVHLDAVIREKSEHALYRLSRLLGTSE